MAPNQNAERHRQDADDGEPRIFHEHSDAQLQVERQSVEPRGTAAFAERLSMLLRAAEGHECATSGFGVFELLLAHQPLRLHLDVKADLVVDPGLGVASGEEAQARASGVEPRHEMLRG